MVWPFLLARTSVDGASLQYQISQRGGVGHVVSGWCPDENASGRAWDQDGMIPVRHQSSSHKGADECPIRLVKPFNRIIEAKRAVVVAPACLLACLRFAVYASSERERERVSPSTRVPFACQISLCTLHSISNGENVDRTPGPRAIHASATILSTSVLARIIPLTLHTLFLSRGRRICISLPQPL